MYKQVHGSKAGQEYEERRQYIRLHSAVDLETLAEGFFLKFDFSNKSTASDALHSSLMATGNEHLACPPTNNVYFTPPVPLQAESCLAY
jgi:hypothetical protein